MLVSRWADTFVPLLIHVCEHTLENCFGTVFFQLLKWIKRAKNIYYQDLGWFNLANIKHVSKLNFILWQISKEYNLTVNQSIELWWITKLLLIVVLSFLIFCYSIFLFLFVKRIVKVDVDVEASLFPSQIRIKNQRYMYNKQTKKSSQPFFAQCVRNFLSQKNLCFNSTETLLAF